MASMGLGARAIEVKKLPRAYNQWGTRACPQDISVLGVQVQGHFVAVHGAKRGCGQVYLKIVQGLRCGVAISELSFKLMD